MPKLPSIVAMNVLAILLGVKGLSAIPGAMFMIHLLAGLNEVPTEHRTTLLYQATGVISGAVLQLGLAFWLAKRSSTMWLARKAALADNASD